MTTYICPFCNRNVKVSDPPSKVEDRWNTLENVLLSMSSRTELIGDKDTHYTCDQRWGFDEALSRVESIMEKMKGSTNDTTTIPIPIWTNANEKERVLNKWKKLYKDTEMLIDAITWTGHYKHPLEVMLWDLSKLITRLEQGLK